MPANPDRAPSSAAADVAWLLLALIVLAGAMVMYWNYPYPGDHRPDFFGFVALFLREALLLAFFGIIGLLLLGLAVVRSSVRLCGAVRLRLKGQR